MISPSALSAHIAPVLIGPWAYVLQPELYSKLSQSKVIAEAALRSGISKGAINAAWDAIGEVIKAWATEGHAAAGLRRLPEVVTTTVAAVMMNREGMTINPSTSSG